MELIKEAFQELKGIDLDDDLFSFDKKGASQLAAFLSTTSEPTLKVIDPAAETEEDLQSSYEGKAICQCCVCGQLIYKDPEDIEIDEETQLVNVEEECPHCANIGGFKVVGQVEPYVDEKEVKVNVDGEDVEVEEKEEVTESCKSRKASKKALKESKYYPEFSLDPEAEISLLTIEDTIKGLGKEVTGRKQKRPFDIVTLDVDGEEGVVEVFPDGYVRVNKWSVDARNPIEVRRAFKNFADKAPKKPLKEDYDERLEDFIGLKGEFKGFSTDEVKQMYTTWDDKLRRPTDPEEIEDYKELKATYREEVEIIDCPIFIEGDSAIDTFNKSYWEIEFSDGTSLSGVSGYNIDLYDYFDNKNGWTGSAKDLNNWKRRDESCKSRKAMKEALKHGYSIHDTKEDKYVAGLGRYPYMVISIHSAIHFDTKEEAEKALNNIIEHAEYPIPEGRYEIEEYDFDKLKEESYKVIDNTGSDVPGGRGFDHRDDAELYSSRYKKGIKVVKEGRQEISEDTIKTKKGWVNKGKAGTHGTFRTKKAADAQRRAMFAQGYKGESLNEDLPPEIVMNMKDDELIDYLTTEKEWSRKDAEAYVKMFTPEHDGTKSFKDLEAGDVIEFLDGKLEGKWRVLLLRPTVGGLTIRIETLEHPIKTLEITQPLTTKVKIAANESLTESEEENEYMNDYIPVELAEEDIEFFDDETGDMIINHPEKLSVGNYLKVKFEDENGESPEQLFKVVEIVEDGKYKLEWISTIRANESLQEKFHPIDENSLNSIAIGDVFDTNVGKITIDNIHLFGIGSLEPQLDISFEREDGTTGTDSFSLRTFQDLLKRQTSIKITEDFQKATVETGSSVLSMEANDEGKITVTSEPRKVEESGDEMIAPPSEELEAEIEANSEVEEEAPAEEGAEEAEAAPEEEVAEEAEVVAEEEPATEESTEEVEVNVDEFEEGYFNGLCKKYLREVYNNVKSYETTKGVIDGNKIKLEGVITFNSGKQAKTSFLFEGKSITKRGKIKFLGENLSISDKRNAFTLTCAVKDNKLLAESLNYNYIAKDASTGKSVRKYNTVKR